MALKNVRVSSYGGPNETKQADDGDLESGVKPTQGSLPKRGEEAQSKAAKEGEPEKTEQHKDDKSKEKTTDKPKQSHFETHCCSSKQSHFETHCCSSKQVTLSLTVVAVSRVTLRLTVSAVNVMKTKRKGANNCVSIGFGKQEVHFVIDQKQ
nr:hypothetical protein BgiMline_014231 [Biomphalaria glabrata]